jgi:hypothetical protein
VLRQNKVEVRMKKLFSSILICSLLFLFGCVNFIISPELENPFIITLYWNGQELEPDQDTGELPVQTMDENGAHVQAEVTDEFDETVKPATYEWYLQGELIEQGVNEIFIDSSREIGYYWLDIIVGKGEILSSEHVDFKIVE